METSIDVSHDTAMQLPSEPEHPIHTKKSKLFAKKFNMNFNMKKFGTAATSAAETAKPVPADEKSEDSDSKSSRADEQTAEDNFLGALQRIRQVYIEQLHNGATVLASAISPSLPSETPVLKPPPATAILIQEEKPDSGGIADLFEGKVGTLGQQADLVEKAAPPWLADVLLQVGPEPDSRMVFC